MAALQPMVKTVPFSRIYVCPMSPAEYVRVVGVRVTVLRSSPEGQSVEVAVGRRRRVLGVLEDRDSQ